MSFGEEKFQFSCWKFCLTDDSFIVVVDDRFCEIIGEMLGWNKYAPEIDFANCFILCFYVSAMVEFVLMNKRCTLIWAKVQVILYKSARHTED